ncbi:hypothetical protein Cgig2_022818 [Carnegiea gigantea]|uniref:pectinesterase n=1 Tax=Carnegiea gigantea TaxID=171969 RepID=A0A9Q1QMC2_9CARY|nr:hypothetical protein Cgig2_022818 [Carnegiea gigantea]
MIILKFSSKNVRIFVVIVFAFCAFFDDFPCLILGQGAISRVIVVDSSGHGHFRSLQHAINSVPLGNKKWIEIQIRPGVYYEKVTIPLNKQYISLVGKDRQRTVIEWWAGGGRDTLAYSTFSVFADNFVARNITFKNSYHAALISQAPAVVLYGDKAAFYECGFVGIQDTLTDLIGRHYFGSCYIEGYVDFIWGYGQSVYQGCTINVTSGPYDDRIYGAGYITAQGRQSKADTNGFVFKYCTVVGTSYGYLGRPYQTYSRVVFYKSYLSDIVVPQGWNPGFTYGDTITREEVECRGPGADTSKRVKWGRSLKSEELDHLVNINTFINQEHWIEYQPSPTRTRPRSRTRSRPRSKPRPKFRPRSYFDNFYGPRTYGQNVFRPRSYYDHLYNSEIYDQNFFRPRTYDQNLLRPRAYDENFYRPRKYDQNFLRTMKNFYQHRTLPSLDPSDYD